jgi:choline dehydrogenase-like flavoprotein
MSEQVQETVLDCDYLVVGAGTAGCVLTARLVQQGLRVVLIEDGLPDAHKYVVAQLTCHQPQC